MRELEEALDTRFGNRFHGSKAQRKNAEKELRKLQTKAAADNAFQRATRIQSLKEDIENLQSVLDNNYKGHWWEIPGIRDPRGIHEELKKAKEELALITG